MSRDCVIRYAYCPGAHVPGSVIGQVASALDIQYRSEMPFRNEYFDDNQPYVKGRFKPIDMLLSREAFVLAEGVIVDTITGGIGYRNHSVPIGLEYGGEWDEDILWIELDIACADNNLSLKITLGDGKPDFVQSVSVLDRGGFANLPAESPYKGWPNLTYSAPADWQI
ncbi:unnamed protein product [Clonostachys byssicola]|uniref:Uncharacterized protein n=1 Tax=Clonostachys byssicola TaxID=160290 RepID=A0A9N9UA13_9HYPO|nr:unnamed protein product [Clonostachys byssicola]